MTIKDIANLANVSPATVSKILNGKAEHIRPETREKVLEIVRQYHYSTSDFIRSSGASRSYKLGILLNRSGHSRSFIRGLVSAAKQLSFFPVINFSENSTEDEQRFLSFLSSESVDGLLWERVDPSSAPLTKEGDCPQILLNEVSAPADTRMPFTEYGYQAAQVLIQHGHSRIAFLAAEDSYGNHRLYEGMQKCLADHQISAAYSQTPFEKHAAMDLIKAGCTAAICVGNAEAASLSNQLLRLNYTVPRDFSILALTDGSDSVEDEYSTIPIPYRAYGEFLISRIVQMIEHAEALPVFTPPELQAPNLHSIASPKDYLSKHVLVVGSVHVDINISTDSLPMLGRARSTKALNIFPGGKGVNQAIGLSKLNKEVYLLGRVGSDYDGIVVQDTLSRNNVRTDGLIRDNKEDTGRAFIFILENGESAITAHSGANQNLSTEDIVRHRQLFSNAAYCLIQTEIPPETVEYAATLAKHNHAKVVLKPSSVDRLSDSLLALTDYFIPNQSEICTLCPDISDNVERCRYFLGKGVGTVILTLGGDGCLLVNSTEATYFPASTHKAVDTTGGCDAFISALVALLIEGADLHKAIYYANCAAGFCVSQLGVVPAMIGREALDLYPYPLTEGDRV